MFANFRRPLRVSILALLAVFGASNVSYAQSTIEPDQAKAFVLAALAVSHVNEEWRLRIKDAKREVAAERLREQANLAVRNAIRETDGISIDTYRSIYYAARRDTELAAYLADLMEQETAEARR